MQLREFRGDLYFPVAKDSDYGVKILPPDFTFNELRGGDTLPDIYRAIAAGSAERPCPPGRTCCPSPISGRWRTTFARWSRCAERRKGRRLQKRLLDQPPWRRRGLRLDRMAACTRARPCLTPAGESALRAAPRIIFRIAMATAKNTAGGISTKRPTNRSPGARPVS